MTTTNFRFYMKRLSIILLALVFLYSCNDNQSKDQQNEAQYDPAEISEFEFKTIGDVQENNTKIVNQIKVFAKGQTTSYQELIGFQAEVQANEEVSVEDLNFDGIPDIRLMQFLPTDESIAYFYWLYDTQSQQFVRNENLEQQVFSPSVDIENEQLVSQWRKKDGTFGADFYEFPSPNTISLVKQEINVPYQESMYMKTVKEMKDGVMQIVSENAYEPNTRLPM